MALIREFGLMLNLIKIKGEYNGTPYNHPGPAHLSTRTGVGNIRNGLDINR